jgi:hypothetical protein
MTKRQARGTESFDSAAFAVAQDYYEAQLGTMAAMVRELERLADWCDANI